MKAFKYKKVQDYILNYITNSEAKGRIEIPSERQLSEFLNISRTTVKYAIDKLVKERVLYKEHGKGTFVNINPNFSRIAINKEVPDAFSLNVKSRGLELETRVLSFKVLYDYPELKNYFGAHVKDFYELKRQRVINRSDYNLEISYFPFRVFPDANRYNFSKDSLFEYMELRGYRPERFKKTIQAVYDENIRVLLELPKNIPLFLEEYETYTADGRLIEYNRTYTDSRLVEYDFYAE